MLGQEWRTPPALPGRARQGGLRQVGRFGYRDDISTPHPRRPLSVVAEGTRRPCYAPASLVLVRPSGATLGFTCTEHAPAWAGGIHGKYLVLERDEWEARGRGYRGRMLGG